MKILPEFKNDTDRLITIAMIIGSIFLIFIPSLIVIFIPKNYISESTYKIAKSFFNLELLLTIISLFSIVPLIGWIFGIFVAPILMIINLIIVIVNLIAVANNRELNIPTPLTFI